MKRRSRIKDQDRPAPGSADKTYGDRRYSVIIPLYNKELEVERAVRSVLGQTYAPVEIIVVDDGSTDGSAAVVESIASPLVKLVRQSNAGVSVARNRGMEEAEGDYYALLDADDEWEPRFLEKITQLMHFWPRCGLYCTGFNIVRGRRSYPANQPTDEGIMDFYLGRALSCYIASGSSSVIPAHVVKKLGGFPEGMKLGEDQYMWTKIVCADYDICFTPEKLVKVYISASNRSSAIYTPERTKYSFRDFMIPGWRMLNEYVARVELGKAITATVRGNTTQGRVAEFSYAYNRYSKRLWRRLWVLNRLPAKLRPVVNGAYERLAWAISKKGL